MKTLMRALPVASHLILVAVIVLIWEKAPEWVQHFVTEYTKLTPSLTVMTILEYAAIVILWIVTIFVFEHLTSLRLWTYLVRDKSLRPLEGEWVQHISLDERPVSVAFIRFDSASERWQYHGVGFEADGTPAATWHTASLRHDDADRSWYFAGTSRMLKGPDKDARYTVVPILHLQDSVDNLTGTVADIGAGGQRRIFDIKDMRRIPQGTVARRLSTTDAIRQLSPNDIVRIMQAAGFSG